MLSLWLNKGMFWVSEQRLVDQAYTTRRNSWITELEIEELERNLAENDSYEEEEVYKVLCKFKTHSIKKTNELFYAGAAVVTNRLGVKVNKAAERKEPTWKRRLQNKIKELRKNLSQFESSKDKEVSNARHWQTLERKYSIRGKILGVTIEELKLRIAAIAAKVRRYQERVVRFRQNKMFQNNQR